MILFVLAQVADLLTAFRLPIGAEQNPVAAALIAIWPLAVAFKLSLIVGVIAVSRWAPALLTLGAMAGAVGAYSNLVAA